MGGWQGGKEKPTDRKTDGQIWREERGPVKRRGLERKTNGGEKGQETEMGKSQGGRETESCLGLLRAQTGRETLFGHFTEQETGPPAPRVCLLFPRAERWAAKSRAPHCATPFPQQPEAGGRGAPAQRGGVGLGPDFPQRLHGCHVLWRLGAAQGSRGRLVRAGAGPGGAGGGAPASASTSVGGPSSLGHYLFYLPVLLSLFPPPLSPYLTLSLSFSVSLSLPPF